MDSWTISKGILFIIIRAAILGGAVFSGVTVGALTYLIQVQSNAGAPHLFGVAAGATIFLGGMAGRDYLTRTWLHKMLPPLPPKP
jgi:hypothetical protein